MPTSQTQHWNALHSMLLPISEGSSCSLMPQASAWAREYSLSVWANMQKNNRTVLGRQLQACVWQHMAHKRGNDITAAGLIGPPPSCHCGGLCWVL